MIFTAFPKIPRLSRDIVVTEKIDGTNASIYIPEADEPKEVPFLVGSRNRWITPKDDNYGFASWAYAHASDILKLGPGHHFGEWWGSGIQRGYSLVKGEKRFSLFNTGRWTVDTLPPNVGVVPTLYTGKFDLNIVDAFLAGLAIGGSIASPGFMDPEGVVIYHSASGHLYKKTVKNDESHKGVKNA